MTHSTASQLRTIGLQLWRDWTEMWNGRPELALTLVAPQFVLHLTTPSVAAQETVTTPEAVERWVAGHRARYQRLKFHFDCDAFVDVTAGVVAGPWHAEAAIDGAPRQVCGIDILAFRDGKITEYWTLSKEVDAVGRWSTRVLADAGVRT
jgi:hypothetical protein